MRPYLELARKMGSLAAQLSSGGVQRVICSYAGELATVDTTLVTAEVLRGLLGHFTDTRVNAINAKTVARSMGVDVDEHTTTRSVDHANSVFVEVVGERRLLVAGTHFEGVPRITRIDDFRVDMQPAGHLPGGAARGSPRGHRRGLVTSGQQRHQHRAHRARP